MNCPEYVNCYCFNPGCSVSIFNALTFSGVKTLLTKSLEEGIVCQVCGEEYVSRPVLEIKLLVHEALHTTIEEISA